MGLAAYDITGDQRYLPRMLVRILRPPRQTAGRTKAVRTVRRMRVVTRVRPGSGGPPETLAAV